VRAVDLRHLGRDRVICAFLLDGVIVDPGPASCLAVLLEALGDEQPEALLLTHIHLDHAGAAGSLARRFPELEVYVHEVGAPHVVDPSRLLRSAARLYGADMDRLWGEVLPVPEDRLRVLQGGEDVRGFQVAYAPGHASHHVVYAHARSGVVFAGDVAGVRIPPATLVVPPTPPPDIDLPAWVGSVELVESFEPEALALTHFGLVADVQPHLAALRTELQRLDADDGSAGHDAFIGAVREQRAAAGDADVVAAYEQAAAAEQMWLGLERFWSRRAATRPE